MNDEMKSDYIDVPNQESAGLSDIFLMQPKQGFPSQVHLGLNIPPGYQ